MKFLCVDCDDAMKLKEAKEPDAGGSIAAIFECPHCANQIAMLTNPAETQMIRSLGIQIGGATKEGGGCPFSGMLTQMESPAESSDLTWTAEALARLENIPEFVRPMAKQGVEGFAKSQGSRVVDAELMEKARGDFGM